MPRFRYSLRTLFIVVTFLAVPCSYLGWQAKIVRDRKSAWEMIERMGGKVGLSEFKRSPLPAFRQWIGDIPRSTIELPDSATQAEIKFIESVFPEGRIIVMPPGTRLSDGIWFSG